MPDQPRAEPPEDLPDSAPDSAADSAADSGSLPDKRYFSIGEVAERCAVKAHVLRYWETEFDQLRPAKRRGNRRYYTAADIALVQRIRHLLYQEGFTISGARQQLMQEHPDTPSMTATTQQPAAPPQRQRQLALLRELEELLKWLENPR